MTRPVTWSVGWLIAALLGAAACHRAPARTVRVCADPNNLPYSTRQTDGFENRLASLFADDRGAHLEYTWSAQRRGFLRTTLNAGRCDIVMGLPTDTGAVLTTRPYYRSSYVFVSRREAKLDITSLDDPRLRRLRVGVQMIGDDATNSPPAHALSRRGIVSNVVGYSVFGDYANPSPLLPIVAAVDRGEVDIAVVWGPVAGFFARTAATPLALRQIEPADSSSTLPLSFDISMAVRRGDDALRAELDDFIRRRRADIDGVLAGYGIPIAKDKGHDAVAP
jgi:mxaJ protein